MESKQLAQICRELAENKKAENVVLLDVHAVSSITDYFVIVTGTSEPHLRAITNEIVDKLRDEHGLRPHGSQGGEQDSWVVLDYFDVMVHVMRPEVRAQYDLEGLWSDAAKVKIRKKKKPARAKTAKPGRRSNRRPG